MHPLVWLLTFVGGNWVMNQVYNGLENNYVAEEAGTVINIRVETAGSTGKVYRADLLYDEA